MGDLVRVTGGGMKTFGRLWLSVSAGLLLIAVGLVWMLWNLGDLLPGSWSWVRWSAPVGLFPLVLVAFTGRAWRSARGNHALLISLREDMIVGGFVCAGLAVLFAGLAAMTSGLQYWSERRLSDAGVPLCGTSKMKFGDRCVDLAGGRTHSYGELADRYWSSAWQAHLAANYFWVSLAVTLVSLVLGITLVMLMLKLPPPAQK